MTETMWLEVWELAAVDLCSQNNESVIVLEKIASSCLPFSPSYLTCLALSIANCLTIITWKTPPSLPFNHVMFHLIRLNHGENIIMICSVNLQQSTCHQNRGMLTPLYTDYVTKPFPPPQKKTRKKWSGNARLNLSVMLITQQTNLSYMKPYKHHLPSQLLSWLGYNYSAILEKYFWMESTIANQVAIAIVCMNKHDYVATYVCTH